MILNCTADPCMMSVSQQFNRKLPKIKYFTQGNLEIINLNKSIIAGL